MTCRAWQHLLQQHLDRVGDPAALEQHLHGCAACAVEEPALRRLLDGVALLQPPAPPVGLADRLAGQLCAEAGRRRRSRLRRRAFSFAGLAAAAAVVAGVGLRSWLSVPGVTGTADSAHVRPKPAELPEAPVRPLRDELADAGNAVAALTAREMEKTRDQTSSLLPVLAGPAIEPLADMPTPMQPLREASANVSAKLAPVTDSFGRAVGLFFRDLPMGKTNPPGAANKPG